MRTTPRSSPASVERVFASAGAAFASRAGVLHGKMSSLDYLDLCRLCLVKDRVSVPIFEGEGDVRQIFLKITACLPVKVSLLRHSLHCTVNPPSAKKSPSCRLFRGLTASTNLYQCPDFLDSRYIFYQMQTHFRLDTRLECR